MTNVSEWSTAPGSNNSAPPDGWPENMLPGKVNDAAREMMAALAKWYQDQRGSLTTAGTATAYTLTTNNGYTSLTDIPLLAFRVHAGNTGAVTLNVDGLGARPVVKAGGSALTNGDLLITQVVCVAYNTTLNRFDLIGPQISVAGLTAAQILTLLLTVDGAGSGLDADLLDGNSSAIFATATALATTNTNVTTVTNGLATTNTTVAGHTTTLGTHTSQIAAHTTSIGTNTSNIATNTTNIATNTTDIATNTTNITTNTNNIATNTSTISSHTGTLATHTSQIATTNTNVTNLTTTVGTKADSSTVTALTTTVGTKADSSTVTALAATVANKADTSTVLLKASNLSDVTTPATAFTNIKQAATTTVTGVTELATAVETQARSSNSVVVTPGGLTDFCRIKTGSYTGDGGIAHALTGVGFAPKYLKIWTRNTTETGVAVYETTDTIIDDDVDGMTVRELPSGAHDTVDHAIKSLDADGFTVDDDGTDQHPNANGQLYNYLAMG